MDDVENTDLDNQNIEEFDLEEESTPIDLEALVKKARRSREIDVSDVQAPSGECSAFGFDHRAGTPHGYADPTPVHVHRLDDRAVVVEECDVERKPHADRVDPTARAQDQCTFEVVAAEQSSASSGPGASMPSGASSLGEPLAD